MWFVFIPELCAVFGAISTFFEMQNVEKGQKANKILGSILSLLYFTQFSNLLNIVNNIQFGFLDSCQMYCKTEPRYRTKILYLEYQGKSVTGKYILAHFFK